MAWNDWTQEMPNLKLTLKCISVKRRVSGQDHVLYRLLDPITVENKDTGELLEVPTGFLCDGASVPGALWGALSADPADLLVPSIAHDYTYREGAKWKKPAGGTRKVNRYEADLVHVAICKLLKVKKTDRAKVFYALRVAGRFAFRNKQVDWDGTE